MPPSAVMPAPEPIHPVPLEKTRELVMQQLCEHYAVENLTTEELQGRLERATHAVTLDELRGLVSDLPVMRADAAAPAAAVAAVPAAALPAQIPEKGVVVAVMGGAARTGRWTPPRQLTAIAVMGGAELDFREAHLGPGVTEVNVLVIMGGVEIVVPPGVQVEMNGVALMGGFEARDRTSTVAAEAGAPVLRIGGFVLMGGVDVDVRYPGETAGEAKRRHRELRKEMRDARRLSRGD
jgi:hypothetical protein